MKAIKIVLILIAVLTSCSKHENDKWKDIIIKYTPQKYHSLKVVTLDDIKDNFNKEDMIELNPDVIIEDDLNNNGRNEYYIPCIDHDHKWHILIIEKTGNDNYRLLDSFVYNWETFYMFKWKADKDYYIQLGNTTATDLYTYIKWNKDNKSFTTGQVGLTIP